MLSPKAWKSIVTLGLLFVAGSMPAGTEPNLLDYNNGPVLANPAIYNLYMDTNWDAFNPSATQADIDAFTKSLVNSIYFGPASQYGVGAASFTGSGQPSALVSIACPIPIVAGVTDFFSIGAWMQCMTAPSLLPFGGTIGGIPAPDGNTVYAVYVPSGTQINDLVASSCGDFGAYHFFGSTLTWQGTIVTPVLLPQNFAYTVVPIDCATESHTGLPNLIDGVSLLASHELIEAATDPIILTGWIDNSTYAFIQNVLKQGEASDICGVQGAGPVHLTNGPVVSAYWSNADGKCVPIIDTTPPVTTAALSPLPNAAGWNNTNVTITLTSTDNEQGGTGVKEIHFTLAGAQLGGDVVSGSTASVTIATEGITTVSFFAIDNAGNQESPKSVIVRIDRTAPTILAPLNVRVGTGPGATLCNAVVSDSTLGFATATDDSGIVTIIRSGVPAGNIFSVGSTAVVYTATDPVDLTSSATQTVTVIDNTPPVLATPPNVTVNATSPAGAVVKYTLPAATDNCPGVSVAGTPPSGSTFAIGTTTVTVTATDSAGNAASTTFQVTVVGAAGQTANLISLVRSFGLPAGITTALTSQLADVLSSINTGDVATACSDLIAFINTVKAQTGKSITAAQAAQLIAAAKQIMAVLGCP